MTQRHKRRKRPGSDNSLSERFMISINIGTKRHHRAVNGPQPSSPVENGRRSRRLPKLMISMGGRTGSSSIHDSDNSYNNISNRNKRVRVYYETKQNSDNNNNGYDIEEEEEDDNDDDDEDVDNDTSDSSDSDDRDDLVPYRGVISGKAASTDETLPQEADIRNFGNCIERAQRKYKSSTQQYQEPETRKTNNSLHQSYSKIKSPGNIPSTLYGHAGGSAQSLLSRIKRIIIGSHEIDTWYTAPYPEEYSKQEVLYLCQHCLRYMSSEYIAKRHALKCRLKRPPGREIYRSPSNAISVYEVDGAISTQYCQNLCLLAKMFLNSKTLYYDVPAFRFYVLTENEKEEPVHDDHKEKQAGGDIARMVGYFSKEKKPDKDHPYNLSCILSMPTAQRKGYGNFLIDFSYLLSRTEGKSGTPEKPLSELGLLAYRNYWKLAICNALKGLGYGVGDSGRRSSSAPRTVSIKELSRRTGMTPGDVTCALERLDFLVRDGETHRYGLCIDPKVVHLVVEKWENKGYERVDEVRLIWCPPMEHDEEEEKKEEEMKKKHMEAEVTIIVADEEEGEESERRPSRARGPNKERRVNVSDEEKSNRAVDNRILNGGSRRNSGQLTVRDKRSEGRLVPVVRVGGGGLNTGGHNRKGINNAGNGNDCSSSSSSVGRAKINNSGCTLSASSSASSSSSTLSLSSSLASPSLTSASLSALEPTAAEAAAASLISTTTITTTTTTTTTTMHTSMPRSSAAGANGSSGSGSGSSGVGGLLNAKKKNENKKIPAALILASVSAVAGTEPMDPENEMEAASGVKSGMELPAAAAETKIASSAAGTSSMPMSMRKRASATDGGSSMALVMVNSSSSHGRNIMIREATTTAGSTTTRAMPTSTAARAASASASASASLEISTLDVPNSVGGAEILKSRRWGGRVKSRGSQIQQQ